MLCGSHRLYPTVKSICITSLLEYLVANEDASLSVGQWAPQKIVDDFSARNYIICHLCTLSSFGQSAPREYAVILHSTLCIVVALSAVGWHVYVHSFLNWNVHLNE